MTSDSVLSNKLKPHLYELIKSCEADYAKLIRKRIGIVIDKQMHELYQTIAEACDKFQCDPKEYLIMLTNCPNNSPLLEHLITGITIGETYFFRDKTQMKLLQEFVLPELIKHKRQENNYELRIWSAGCSSGEEIYTIAIILHELLADIKKWTLKLLGTDINIKHLQKALNGQYTDWSMRSILPHYKDKYFFKCDNKFILIPQIKNLVNFQFLNLNDDVYPSIFNQTNAQDLIICRNVLIYFDTNIIESLMQKFSKSLTTHGYLMLGASDPINIKSTDLTFHFRRGSLFSLTSHMSIEQEKITKTDTISQPKIIIDQKLQSKFKITASKKPSVKIANKDNQLADFENQITQLIGVAEWQQVLDLIAQYEIKFGKTNFILNAKAVALANLGQLTDAIELLKICVANDPTNKEIYFIYALTLLELNKLDDCERALRKTLFLDHEFVPGHFQLGLLLIKINQQEAGLKSLRNALWIAQNKEPHLLIPGSQGLNYGRLAEILKKEINLYAHMEK